MYGTENAEKWRHIHPSSKVCPLCLHKKTFAIKKKTHKNIITAIAGEKSAYLTTSFPDRLPMAVFCLEVHPAPQHSSGTTII